MKPEKLRGALERAALSAAQKAVRRNGGVPLTRDDLLALRVQTVPLWVRLTIAGFGLALLVLGYVLAGHEEATGAQIGGATAGAVGFVTLLLGVMGKRKTLSSVLHSVGEASANSLLELIVRGTASLLD